MTPVETLQGTLWILWYSLLCLLLIAAIIGVLWGIRFLWQFFSGEWEGEKGEQDRRRLLDNEIRLLSDNRRERFRRDYDTFTQQQRERDLDFKRDWLKRN